MKPRVSEEANEFRFSKYYSVIYMNWKLYKWGFVKNFEMKLLIIFAFAVVIVAKAQLDGIVPSVVPPDRVPPVIPPVTLSLPDLTGPLPVIPKIPLPLPAPLSPIDRLTGIKADPKCLLNLCGPPLGMFTLYCNILCTASGYDAGKCTCVQGEAQCLCDGNKGEATLVLKVNCGVLCGICCNTCGYRKGTCSIPLTLTVKNSARCTCT